MKTLSAWLKKQQEKNGRQGVESVMDTGWMSFVVFGIGYSLLILAEVIFNWTAIRVVDLITVFTFIVSIALCSIFAYKLLQHVRQGEIFSFSNVAIITNLGVSLRSLGFLLLMVAAYDGFQSLDQEKLWLTTPSFMLSVFLGVLGSMLFLIAIVMKRGLHIQQEQELTI